MRRLTPLTIAFLVLALPTALVLALLTPPGLVQDEVSHIGRANAILGGDVVARRRPVMTATGKTVPLSGVRVEPSLLWVVGKVVANGPRAPMTAATMAELRAFPWSKTRIYLPTGSIALYMPVFYVPAAVGIRIAKAAGTTPYDAIIAGRLANLVAFGIIGTLVLQVARRGRAVMFCGLVCPMTLSLAGSFNQDGQLIATSLLAAALTTAGRRTTAAVLIAALAMIKLPYGALAILVLAPLPPLASWRHEWRTLLRRFGLMLLTLLPGLAWTAWMMASFASPNLRPTYAPGPLWPGDPARLFDGTDAAAQLEVLRAMPGHVLAMPFIQALRDTWVPETIIGILGQVNDVHLPHVLLSLWWVALPLAALADMLQTRQPGPRWTESGLYVLAAIACIYAVYMTQFLTWSQVGEDQIQGMQGRYVLPLAGLLALALPQIRIPHAQRLSSILKLGPVAACIGGAIALPVLVVTTWYLR